MKYFEKNAVDDVNDIHRAWAIERIGGWGDNIVPGPSRSPKKENDKKTNKHARLYNRSQSVHELQYNNGTVVPHVPLVRPVSHNTGDRFDKKGNVVTHVPLVGSKTREKTQTPFTAHQQQHGSSLDVEKTLRYIGAGMDDDEYEDVQRLFEERRKKQQYTQKQLEFLFAAQEADARKGDGARSQKLFFSSEWGSKPSQSVAKKYMKGSAARAAGVTADQRASAPR
eukprot:1834452-Rhodomonas_salina.1